MQLGGAACSCTCCVYCLNHKIPAHALWTPEVWSPKCIWAVRIWKDAVNTR